MDSSPARLKTKSAASTATRDATLTPGSAGGKTKRKTKRLVWTDEMHLQFVAAVFERAPIEDLTAEHIKSHLQKYRINYERSRLEVQRLNEKHTKRNFKRHHKHIQHREIVDTTCGFDGPSEPVGAGTSERSPSASITTTSSTATPMDTDQQWNMCDALLLEDEASEQHIHWTMQQRMDFHRELLLTRSVEEASARSWASRMKTADASGIGGSRAASSDDNYSEIPDAARVELVSMSNPQPASVPQEGPEAMDADEGVDLSSWGRLSLTVDPDDDDVFGFLRP
ncbi:unnamed protein product [Phytophthora lilii]|uniref:Unnamed protein product n=1 Tax=Phytophthora lilii TaxID=2077276 RepID=A0A9W6THN5_9STRA|nr:unnamed protein product [Phytophthora lilii]